MRRLLILFAILPFASDAFAWGAEGHQVVVQIALRFMTQKQRTAVYHLLGTHDRAMIGHWADSIRPHRHYTERWHYVDIPKDSLTYDSARDCAEDCIIAELARVQVTLHDTTADSLTRREALLFWFHLVGDLYQPFHCYNDNDRGANNLKIVYRGRRHSMHELWDNVIIKEKNPSAFSLAAKLYRKYGYPRQTPSVIEAANQSHARALDALLAPGTTLSSKYRRHAWSVIQRCLWEAGCMAAEVEIGG
jgi:nuclease S1